MRSFYYVSRILIHINIITLKKQQSHAPLLVVFGISVYRSFPDRIQGDIPAGHILIICEQLAIVIDLGTALIQ